MSSSNECFGFMSCKKQEVRMQAVHSFVFKLLWNQEAKQPGLISHVQILKFFLSQNIFSYHFYKKKQN